MIIDYLQLMSGAKRIDNRVQEISEITRNLKIMAKELNVPVITLSQLSRASEQRTEHRPVLSDLQRFRIYRAGRGHRFVPVPPGLLQ